MHWDGWFCAGPPICTSYHFVIIHIGVDHSMGTRSIQFIHVYNQVTHIFMSLHMCTSLPWKCTHMWHAWHACVKLVSDLYRKWKQQLTQCKLILIVQPYKCWRTCLTTKCIWAHIASHLTISDYWLRRPTPIDTQSHTDFVDKSK